MKDQRTLTREEAIRACERIMNLLTRQHDLLHHRHKGLFAYPSYYER
jgi:hypothetical protein